MGITLSLLKTNSFFLLFSLINPQKSQYLPLLASHCENGFSAFNKKNASRPQSAETRLSQTKLIRKRCLEKIASAMHFNQGTHCARRAGFAVLPVQVHRWRTGLTTTTWLFEWSPRLSKRSPFLQFGIEPLSNIAEVMTMESRIHDNGEQKCS